MNMIVKSTLAAAGLAFAIPSLAWAAWPDIDFEWYANVGRAAPAAAAFPAPRAGYIWVPARYEWTGEREVFVAGGWIVDDYDRQWRAAAADGSRAYGDNGSFDLRDRDGNLIALDAPAYTTDLVRR
jgi:hypothetical protein